MPHIQGTARDAVLHFPPTLDEYIAADNPVRVIDAFSYQQREQNQLIFHFARQPN
jgi:hypothetical protein